MKLGKAKLKEILKEEFSNVFEEDELSTYETSEQAPTAADEVLVQIETSIAKLDELAKGVGHVEVTKELPQLLQLQSYVTDLSHRLRGR